MNYQDLVSLCEFCYNCFRMPNDENGLNQSRTPVREPLPYNATMPTNYEVV